MTIPMMWACIATFAQSWEALLWYGALTKFSGADGFPWDEGFLFAYMKNHRDQPNCREIYHRSYGFVELVY